uniref:Uncharacterized protein n=1 Tax=Ganoderma boninense TaxID=34458 RepID=A0A5K1JZZ1_9APHY|nr:Uncharacterized protein [Ganoderma boninense]
MPLQVPPPAPTIDRRSALLYLLREADAVDSSFFNTTTGTEGPPKVLPWTFHGLELTVKKRTLSQANSPSNITYDVNLGEFLQGSTKPLLAYVLRPKGDPEANRAAFKRCLEDLAVNKAALMSQQNA